VGVSRGERASSVRRAVARRLSYSFHTSVPVALMREYEAGRLMERYRAWRDLAAFGTKSFFIARLRIAV
jgi:hypothetical protein